MPLLSYLCCSVAQDDEEGTDEERPVPSEQEHSKVKQTDLSSFSKGSSSRHPTAVTTTSSSWQSNAGGKKTLRSLSASASGSQRSFHGASPSGTTPLQAHLPGAPRVVAAPKRPLDGHPRYELICDLFEGTSGIVQLAWDRQELGEVAIKFIERGSTTIKGVMSEIMNLRLCFMHPHILQLLEVFLTDEFLAISTQYAAGGDLAEFVAARCQRDSVTALPEAQARYLFQQLIIAVDFCHQMGIANRDIKLENILLMDPSDRPTLKLCDFGYSKDEFMGSACKTMCGTPEYVAPEILLNERYRGITADVWSCGVVLYVMLAGHFPFRTPEEAGQAAPVLLQRMFPRILRGEYEVPPGASPHCLDLLRRIMTVDSEKRITIPEIMRHPWFLEDLPLGLEEANSSLLEAPLALQFCKQSEDEIEQLAQEAMTQRGDSRFGTDSLPY